MSVDLNILYSLYKADSLKTGDTSGFIKKDNFSDSVFSVSGNKVTVTESDGDTFTYNLSDVSANESSDSSANSPLTGSQTVSALSGTNGKTYRSSSVIRRELEAVKSQIEATKTKISENKQSIKKLKTEIDNINDDAGQIISEYIDKAEDIEEEIKAEVKRITLKETEKYKNGEYKTPEELNNAIESGIGELLSSDAVTNLKNELENILNIKKTNVEFLSQQMNNLIEENKTLENKLSDLETKECSLTQELQAALKAEAIAKSQKKCCCKSQQNCDDNDDDDDCDNSNVSNNATSETSNPVNNDNCDDDDDDEICFPPEEEEPQGFSVTDTDGTTIQYDFFVDRDNNNDITDASEFLGAERYAAEGKEGSWSEMTELDTNNDGFVTTDELEAGNIHVVKTTIDKNGNKIQETLSADEAFGHDEGFKIDTNQNSEISQADVPVNFNNEKYSGNKLLGNFNVTFEGKEHTGYQTADTYEYLNDNYTFSSGQAERKNQNVTSNMFNSTLNSNDNAFKYDIDEVLNSIKPVTRDDLIKYAEEICAQNNIDFSNSSVYTLNLEEIEELFAA